MTDGTPICRFRFGLRTLLAVVTLAAVGSWAYWIGWPWWRDYREQKQFLDAVKQLRLGFDQWEGRAPVAAGTAWKGGHTLFDRQHNMSTLAEYKWSNAYYLVYCCYPSDPKEIDDRRAVSLEVFRLPPVRVGYQPCTSGGTRTLAAQDSTVAPDEAAYRAYISDFAEIVAGLDGDFGRVGQRVINSQVPYKLIYSYPPPK